MRHHGTFLEAYSSFNFPRFTHLQSQPSQVRLKGLSMYFRRVVIIIVFMIPEMLPRHGVGVHSQNSARPAVRRPTALSCIWNWEGAAVCFRAVLVGKTYESYYLL